MSRFFADISLSINQVIELPEMVFHHWIRVLRANVGEQATLFNGLGGEYAVELVEINKRNAMVRILSFNSI